MSVSLRRVSAVVLAVGVLTAACGGDDDSSVTGPETAQPTAEVVATPEPATTAAPPEEPVEPAPEVPETASAAILSQLELPRIEFTIPPSGLGDRPQLEWAPVEGADEYHLVVLDAERRPYWAWVTSTTSVPFGGGEPGSPAGQLAILHEPMTASLVAYDSQGAPLASSELFPLVP